MLKRSTRTRIYVGSRGGTAPTDSVIAGVLRDAGIDGATIFQASGVWRGDVEWSSVIEVISLDSGITSMVRADGGGFRSTIESRSAETIVAGLRGAWPQVEYLVVEDQVWAGLLKGGE